MVVGLRLAPHRGRHLKRRRASLLATRALVRRASLPPDSTRPRTALVTGASRGIGRATVDTLLARGWRVAAGMRDAGDAAAAPGLLTVELDVTNAAEVRAAVAAAERFAGGALDAVVCNAGYALVGAVEDVDLDDVRALLETNTLGALAVVQAALPAMRRAGRGSVVVVSTVGAGLSTPLLGAYRASKAALNALAEVLAMEMRPFGVRVSRVEPGMVATDFPRATRRSGSVADGAGPYLELAAGLRNAMGRWRERHEVPAEAVAAAIAALVEDPDPPRSVLVGPDAELLAGSGDDELLGFLEVEWPLRP